MTTSSNFRSRTAHGTEETTADAGAWRPAGVHLALRRRQRIALQHDASDHVFVVQSGCLTLDAMLPENRRQVMLVLYAGDVISRAASPPVPQVGLTAMLPSAVERVRLEDFSGMARPGVPAGVDLALATARICARCGLHSIAIGRLSGEERIATLLLEMALYLGRQTPGGHSFEIPLTRNDMADYMALNPDTLSRLVSRMRSSGLVTMPTRSRATIKDLTAIESMTPLADAMRRLRRGSAAVPQIAEA